MKRRLFQGLLIFTLLCGAVLLAHPTAAWALTGSGTSKDPYQIGLAADLKEFAERVNSEDTDACAKLTADITLTGENWTPIGKDKGHMYNGTFDGNGHTIYGLYINSAETYAGLFGVIGTGGMVQNLTLADSYIDSSGIYVGGICGYSKGSISDCSNSGTVTGSGNYVGGICGYSKGSISDCSNSGTVTGSGNFVGGICGCSYDSISDCSNSGTVTGGYYTGGICGFSYDSISDCSNSGTVTGSGNFVGGICGVNYSGSISGCSNSGSVTGNGSDSDVGGICGYSDGSISNCYWLNTTASAGVGDGSEWVTNVEKKNTAQFASGEVAWLLNRERENGPWRQNLSGNDKDKFPTLDQTHGVVVRLTFNANTDKEEDNIICYGNANASVAVPENPKGSPDTVCIFGGWYGSKNFAESDKLTDKNVTVTSDKEYWAKWTANVTLHTNGGSIGSGDVKNYTYGTGAALPTDVTCAGYTFGGWYASADFSGEPVTAITASDTGDKEYWAKWTAVPSGPSTYQIVLDSDITGGTVTASPRWAARGDTVYLTVTADEGYELSTLSVSDRNGNAITLDNEGGGVYSFTMPIGRVTVTATFDKAVIELPFTDVNADDWFYDPVCFVYENGLMTGTSADTFEPNTSLSRAMLVAVLHRLEGSPAASGSNFSDVADGDWYAEAVNWAAANGVVNGMGDGSFQPNAAITREQMAAILRNFAQYKGMDVSTSGDLSAYSDAASVSSWAEDSVAWAVNQGLISGMTVDTLQPQGLSTRAQVAAVLQRYLAE